MLGPTTAQLRQPFDSYRPPLGGLVAYVGIAANVFTRMEAGDHPARYVRKFADRESVTVSAWRGEGIEFERAMILRFSAQMNKQRWPARSAVRFREPDIQDVSFYPGRWGCGRGTRRMWLNRVGGVYMVHVGPFSLVRDLYRVTDGEEIGLHGLAQ